MPSRSPTTRDLSDEVRAFVERRISAPDDFDALTAKVLARQLRHYPTYGHLAESRGVNIDALEEGTLPWTAVPPMPTSAFAHLPLHIGAPTRTFRSSGTTRDGSPRSEHHHSELELYRTIIDHTFPTGVFGDADPAPGSRTILSLIPPVSLVEDSSLGFMIDHVMGKWADERSIYAFDGAQLQPGMALDWLQAVGAAADPPVVLTTALALWTLLEAAEGSEEAVRTWPANLRIMETGGFKTERFRLTREDLLRRLEQQAGVAPVQVVREYGMTELTSQAYSDPRHDPDVFELPPWVHVRTLDPETLDDVDRGTAGLLAFLDLGNVASAAYVLTEDLGRLPHDQLAAGRRFELLGRARDAQLRGCSLTTEQLLPT